MSIHLTLIDVNKSCSLYRVILSWENQQRTTTVGLVPNGIQFISISQENRKKKWYMGIKLTVSVLAYECHDRNLSSLLGKMAIERKQKKRQEKLEKMEIALSQSWCRNEWLQCNKLPHTSFSQSACTLISLGDLFFFQIWGSFPTS